MSANNQTGVDEAAHYERFEALPPAFRKALRYASHDLTVGWVERTIEDYGEDAALAVVRRALARRKRESILEHYGPDHPQLTFKSNHVR